MPPIIVQLVFIVGLGIVAQWVAWRIHLPSILLLLAVGLVAGPITGFLDPDALFGDLLLPIVSLSVSVILFEGGLSLRFRELGSAAGAVARLSTVGAGITWALGSLAALWILELETHLALVMGALFVVTGPTVVGPMLRQLRPKGQAGHVLRWEGITTDPIGAILAVVLFETLVLSHSPDAARSMLTAAARTIFLGGGAGILAALALRQLLHMHILPDWLQGPWGLMMVFVAYVLGNAAQPEAGLLSVTVMGAFLANRRELRMQRIAEFKENLQILLLSGLFILLAARVDTAQLMAIGWREVLFVLALIVVVRPVTVLLSTLGSLLAWRERWLVAALAPRGIVSAALASVIALEMAENQIHGGERVVPVAFSVIVLTVVIYSIGTPLVARALGLSDVNPQGFLILGAHRWARALGKSLQELGHRVVVVDTNRRNVVRARLDGLSTVHGNILSEGLHEELDYEGIGHFLAVTPNDEVNTLACERMAEMFGSGAVFQLAEDGEADSGVGGRRLFANGVHYAAIDQLFRSGAVLKRTRMTDEFTLQHYRELYGEMAVPMYLVDASGKVQLLTESWPERIDDGQRLVGLVHPVDGTDPKP